jgi:Fe-S oxidoreductase/nitrate reductase gamma subunit
MLLLATETSEKTREIFWGLPTWAKVIWFGLIAISVIVFAYGVARPLSKYRRGLRFGWPPRSQTLRRLWSGTKLTLSHATIARRNAYVGWAHRGIFYGFVVLFIGTVILAINTDFTEPILGWRFFQGNFFLGYSIVLDILGLALFVGLGMMMVRRLWGPKALDYSRPDREPTEPQYDRRTYVIGDWTFIGILLILVVTGYLLEGARLEMDRGVYGYEEFHPVGWVASQTFAGLGLGEGTMKATRLSLWWFHGVLALAFVAAIPYTKAVHMLASFASLAFRDPLAGKRLREIPEERAAQPAGYDKLADFSSLHLLQLDACTKCGKCHVVCPANAVGMPLSPRDVVLELREQANATLEEGGIGGVVGSLLDRERGNGTLAVGVAGEHAVKPETVWSCMQCNACVEICPVGIEQAPIINQFRRHFAEEGELDPNLQQTFETIHKTGNSFGENRRKRGRWTRELDFEVKDARKEPVDVLWFVGDYASFDPRSQAVSRTIARLLRAAEVDFGILYEGERNSGNDVRRAGEEGLFELLCEENVGTLSECDFGRIVTSDPHTLNTLRNEYPEYGGSWEVLHHTQLLLELITQGRLDVRDRLSYRVTYHDPCYLGRHLGIYGEPREIIRLLGCELIEMPRNRDNSFCCGAGGGRIWIPDDPGQERPSENRIREAVGAGEPELFVVSCPKDVTMYEDAIKTSGNSERIELRELTELIAEALDRAPTEAAAV